MMIRYHCIIRVVAFGFFYARTPLCIYGWVDEF